MDLNEKIRSLRAETGMTRKAFAEHFGIPLRTMEDWEAARRTPPEYIPKLLTYQWQYEQLTRAVVNKKSKDRCIDTIVDTQGHKILVIHDDVFRNNQIVRWCDVEQYLDKYAEEMYAYGKAAVESDKDRILRLAVAEYDSTGEVAQYKVFKTRMTFGESVEEIRWIN